MDHAMLMHIVGLDCRHVSFLIGHKQVDAAWNGVM